MRGPAGVETLAERDLGAGTRVVAVEAAEFTVESPAAAPPPGTCCADVINRQTITAAPDGFAVASNEQVAAFEQTVAADAGRRAMMPSWCAAA